MKTMITLECLPMKNPIHLQAELNIIKNFLNVIFSKKGIPFVFVSLYKILNAHNYWNLSTENFQVATL